MPPVQNVIDSPAAERWTHLAPALREALLPLAFEQVWHSVQALDLAPDLPDGWFGTLVAALGLRAEDGLVRVPEGVLSVVQRDLQAGRPRLYRDLAVQAADRAFDQDDVQGAVRLLLGGGLRRQAEVGLVAWVDRTNLANHFDEIRARLEQLPASALTLAVRGAWWHAMVREGGAAGAEARRAAQAAYDAGAREPDVMFALLLAQNFDGQNELALTLADELLRSGVGGQHRLRALHQRAMALHDLGRRAEHLVAAQALIDEARRQARVDYLASGHAALAYALEEDGQWTDAARHYERAVVHTERNGKQGQLLVVLTNYAQFLAHTGQTARARLKLAQARACATTGHRAQAAWLAMAHAIIEHQSGAHAEALLAARAAVQAAQAASLDGHAFSALLIETQRLALDGQGALAATRLQEARALLDADSTDDALALRFTEAVHRYLTGDRAAAVQDLSRLNGEENLHRWDRARLTLYLLDAALHGGLVPSTADLDRHLQALGTDAPLRTDAACLTRAASWLATQPAWAERVGHALRDGTGAGSVTLRFELFAPLGFQHDSGALHVSLRRAAELLAYLALHGPSTRQDLLTALFGATGDGPADHFKKVLRSLRDALAPLLPEGEAAVTAAQGRYRLNSLLAVTCSWYPAALFPNATLRTGGPLTITGAFLDGAAGPWRESLLDDVRDELVQELERQNDQRVPRAADLLSRARAL